MDNKLYEIIFKRKSFHLFLNVGDEKITQEELDNINNAFEHFEPLYKDIKVKMRIVKESETTCHRRAEYCLLLYSENKDGYLQNVGYIGEQIDLYLVSKNIGTLWFGIGKAEEKEIEGLEYVIMIAIRKISDQSKYRKDMYKSKRKDLDEIWTGQIIEGVSDVVRFAPSACNSQPWLVKNGETLDVYRYKEEGKRKARFASFDGLTGETKIVPKEGMVEKATPYPYLFFGSLFFVVEAVAVMVVFSIFRHAEDLVLRDVAYSVLTIGAIGFVILIYNILPIRIDSMTDGYRLTMVSNPKNKLAFNELLRVEYEISQGNDDVEIKIFDEITNFTADLNLNKVYALLDKKEYKEAEEILDKIIDAKQDVSEKVYIRARAQKIYINLITKNLEESKEYYDKEVPVSERREISNDVSMASIRAYLLMSGLLDKSRSECIIALNNVYSAFKHTPKNRQHTELVLFNEALQKVVDAHPDWELEGYKLQESN